MSLLPRFMSSGVSNERNAKLIRESPMYEAFGHIVRSGPDECMYIVRIGTGHLEEGDIYYYTYHISTDKWDEPVLLETRPAGKDFRDIWGGLMDNGVHVYGSSISANNLGGGDFSMDEIFMRKGNPTTKVYGPKKQLFGTGGMVEGQVTKLSRGTLFGGISAGANPGTYYWMLFQWSMTTGGVNSMHVLKTTDYWETCTAHLMDSSTVPWSEGCVEYLGGTNLGVWIRIDNGSYIRYQESHDDGVTWIDKTTTRLGYSALGERIIWTDRFGTGSNVNVIFQDRNSGFIATSLNNNPADFVNHAITVPFNPEKTYFFNYFGSGGNPCLGYFSRCYLADKNLYISVWSAEYVQATNPDNTVSPQYPGRANLWYTRDSYQLPVRSQYPTAPPAFSFRGIFGTDIATYVTNNYFRVDIINYTQRQLANIDYWEWCVSTHADFSVPLVTTNILESGIVFDNFRVPAMFIFPKELTASTTYYFKVRAVNALGASAYTLGQVTTLA